MSASEYPTWSERLKAAAKSGAFTKDDRGAAGSWRWDPTSAEGGPDGIEREPYGNRPMDSHLQELGKQFTHAVIKDDVALARKLYGSITARKLEIIERAKAAATRPVPDHDKKLWFRYPCYGDENAIHYMLGNCETFPGRMLAYCPHKGNTFCVSRSEMTSYSQELGWWMDGFAHGDRSHGTTASEDDDQ